MALLMFSMKITSQICINISNKQYLNTQTPLILLKNDTFLPICPCSIGKISLVVCADTVKEFWGVCLMRCL